MSLTENQCRGYHKRVTESSSIW